MWPSPTRRSGNLPAEATSFVGRRGELAELRKSLNVSRLVSLVGPGGVGKTRLAVRIATDPARGFADGAWLVEFADVRDSPHTADIARKAGCQIEYDAVFREASQLFTQACTG